jgi:dephospho-CoA kinase
MSQPHIIFISGASGAGKTTLVETLKEKYFHNKAIGFFHFDSIGVPSEAGMIREFGSGKAWQKAKTYQWVKTILQECLHQKIAIIEGQTELSFIEAAFKLYGVKFSTILLMHADADVRHRRLKINRNQAELVNAEMDNWSNYLLNQALAMGVEIIDNSNDLEEAIKFIQNLLTEINPDIGKLS